MMGVAVSSVANWVDRGQLKAGRTPGGHRRVTEGDLLEFLQRQQLPIPSELRSHGVKVLVVDDEEAVARWIATEIRDEHPDYEVREAADGFAAGEVVGSWAPDVVVLDLRMPGLDGYEVCRRIKANPKTKDIAVIAITARFARKTEQEIIDCGALACLSKPLDLVVLMEHIDGAVRRRK